MKIVILIAKLPPAAGGSAFTTVDIAARLAKKGHEVHVISGIDKERIGIQRSDFHIYYIKGGLNPRASTLGSIAGIVLYSLLALVKIKRISPDIVHAMASYRGGLCALLAKRFLKKPYCISDQGHIYGSWRFKSLGSERLRNAVLKLFFRQADAVTALTQDMKERIQEICGRDAVIVSNGIDLERFQGLSHRNTHKLAKSGERIILFVGRLVAWKGVAYLIEAMNAIIKRNPKARLLVVGDGPERQNLGNLVEKLSLAEYVKFAGEVPYEKVPEYMAASDVLVVPSLGEPFGLVNLEAMACGLPIVATNAGGIPEIVKDGENGFLVELGNSAEIAEKVLILLKNDNLRRQISQNNLQEVKKYSWEGVVDKLERVYLGVLKRGSDD